MSKENICTLRGKVSLLFFLTLCTAFLSTAFATSGIEQPSLFEEEPLIDSDGDFLPDDLEIQIGTNPFNPDTDGDGLSDLVEVFWGLDPLNPPFIPEQPDEVEDAEVEVIEWEAVEEEEVEEESVEELPQLPLIEDYNNTQPQSSPYPRPT